LGRSLTTRGRIKWSAGKRRIREGENEVKDTNVVLLGEQIAAGTKGVETEVIVGRVSGCQKARNPAGAWRAASDDNHQI